MKRPTVISVISLVALAFSASAAQAGSVKFFESPDHNIACAMIKHTKRFNGGLRCDMINKVWTSPRPNKCEFDSGGGATLGEKGRGKGECVSDSIMGQGGVLAAGATATKGQFSCTLDLTGTAINCVNRKNNHGFSMSPAAISFF